MSERFLVTGALGCIGAWAVKRLVDEGTPVFTYDLPGDPHRLRLIMSDDSLARVTFITGDITDQPAFERAIVDNGVTHVVHLAALQVPFVRANPILGAQVNVAGHAIVLETVKRHMDQVRGLAYASSMAVYGPPRLYPRAPLAHDAPRIPPNLYGVYKKANEEMARIFWQDYRLPSIGLRPYVVYGPGRDQGMTSTPTKAMLAVAVGRPYHITYGGVSVFQHADDMAGAFIQAARLAREGAEVYNPGGSTVSMEEVVAAIEAAAPHMAGRVTFEPTSLPFPETVDDRVMNAAFGPAPWRDLSEGVRQTVDHFRKAVAGGKIDVDRILQ